MTTEAPSNRVGEAWPPCQLCGRTDYPHECMTLPTILNARYYCADGSKHQFRQRRFGRARCERCGEKAAR